jgi:hypothetical protein
MKNNYNIKENPPELSSNKIRQHQNFDALFASYQETTPSLDETGTTNTPVHPIGSSTKVPPWVLKYGLGALVAIAASMLLVFMLQQMVSISGGQIPSSQIDEILALQAPMTNFEKPYASMLVSLAEKGQTLNYHSGSKIIVPASAFVDKEGKAVKGKVDIQYREFNDHVDMFLAGVPKELDKHQNLQSVGMMEIKGFQDGEPVFLSMDKTLDVEIKSKITATILTKDLEVYVYSKQKDAWGYTAADRVEVIASSQTASLTDSVVNNRTAAEILAEVKVSLATTKPIKPIAPGIPDNMQVFQFDISISDFPELAAYDQKVELMVDVATVNDEMFKIEWNSMDMKGLGNNKYELTLTRDEKGEAVVKKLQVYPYIAATAASDVQYRSDLANYNTKQQAWESDVAAAVEEIKVEGDVIASVAWKEIINRFTIHRFGLWNCGKTVEMKGELEIDANFIDENGDAVALNKLFITNKTNQLYYFAPNLENTATSTLKYDVNAENLIWALTENNELLVANINKTTSEDTPYTFEMKAAGVLQSEEDIRNVLTF